MRANRSIRTLGFVPVILVLCPSISTAQAVQTVSAIAKESAPAAAAQMEDAIARVEAAVKVYKASASKTERSSPSSRQLDALADQGARVVGSQADPDTFRARYEAFRRDAQKIKTELLPALPVPQRGIVSKAIEAAPRLPSAPSSEKPIKDVIFTVTLEQVFGKERPVNAAGLSTNLASAAAGGIFDAMGAAPLKSFLVNNVTMDTFLPTHGPGKPSARAGLALGSVNLKWKNRKITLHPALNMEQLDASDTRVPADLIRRSTSKNWSAPIFAVGIALGGEAHLRSRLADHGPAFVVTAGVRLPLFFPGDAGSAVGALFTNRRSDYERSGHAAFLLGISVVLTQPKSAGDS